MSINNQIKFKYLTSEELLINLDRLSRFKLPDISFERVFFSIISSCLIMPKYSKREIIKLSPEYISTTVEKIWNESVKHIYGKYTRKDSAYKILKNIHKKTFKNFEEKTEIYMNTGLSISEILSTTDIEKLPLNLKFLKKSSEIIKDNKYTYEDLIKIRTEYSLKYPVEKLIIAEGITEEILLPVLAKKNNIDFDKKGIYVAGAGGKSKSPDLYSLLRDKIRIPVTILFDKDAYNIASELNKIILKKDKTVILEQGEFEDILSVNLIKRALNNEYEPVTPLTSEELRINDRMCKNIENFYRTRKLGEYKKSEVSKIIAKNIKYDTDITKDVKELFKVLL